MLQFAALFKKEFSSYFRSYFGYITFGFYLFVSIGSSFYFGSYFNMKDTGCYSLFYLQPFILAIFLPALTMKVWSEEYRSGTAEFLLTQPVAFAKTVWAKLLASALFGILMSLFLLPLIFYTSTILLVDWGNIFCCFIGLFLLISLLCSLGCFISALNRQIIISYLLTVIIGLFWIILPFTKLYENYTNFLFAQIGISEIIYFISFIGLAGFLNVLVLWYRFSALKNKNWKFTLFCGLAFLGTVILNGVAGLMFGDYKKDFTSHGQYTPEKISLEIIEQIKEPLFIDVYVAKDYLAHNPENYYYFQQVKRFLRKYETQSRGMIRLRVEEVSAFSALENEVLDNDLYFEENANGSKNYFGAIIHDDKGKGLTIKQFIPARKDYLEKDVDKILWRFVNEKTAKNIGVYLDSMQNVENFQTFLLDLENDYNVMKVEEDAYEISPKLDLLILINPKNISLSFMYAIDQYIVRGGKILIFFDVYTEGQNETVNDANLRILNFLDSWNVKLNNKFAENPVMASEFSVSDLPLDLYRAVLFEVANENIRLEPVIKEGDYYVGVLLKGRVSSLFFGNPHKSEKILSDMHPYKAKSDGDVTVGIISDVDIITDKRMRAEESPDYNPYGIIANSANGESIRYLIDYIINSPYLELPVKKAYKNSSGIGGKIGNTINGKYLPIYEELLKKMEKNNELLRNNKAAAKDKMNSLKKVSEAGTEMSLLERQAENVLYEMKKSYFKEISEIMIIWSVVYPLGVIGLLMLLTAIYSRRKKHWIKVKYNE